MAAISATPALAQLEDRTGPKAAAPALPSFPAAPSPRPDTGGVGGGVAAAPPTGMLKITDVIVTQEGSTNPARALADWAPTPDAATGIALDRRPDEPLDAAWVRRQFVANHLIGDNIASDRIAALIQLINLAFVRNGYVNSGVLLAGQDLSDGLLRLRLILGHLSPKGAEGVQIRWANDRRGALSDAFIRNRLRAATREPLNLPDIERDFRLLADDPAIRTINADLRPGAHPGEASLLLAVDPAPRVDAYVTAANNRSPSVGGERIAIGASVANLLRPGDRISAEYGSTDGLDDFVGDYELPVGGPNLTALVRGGFNRAAVTDRVLDPLDIRSREYYVEGGVTTRLLADPLLPGDAPGRWRAAQTATAGLLVVHRRLDSSLLGEPFSFSPGAQGGRIEYSAARLTGDYTRRSPGTVLAVAMTATIGIDGTRSDPVGGPTPGRHFTALLVQANYAHRLTPRRLELRVRIAGQAAGGLLYSPERFGIGGADTVRGYRESLLLADEVLVGSIGLARPFDLSGRGGGNFRWASFTLAAFADGALAHNRTTLQPVPTGIASVGASADWTPAPWLFARLTFAQPLRHVLTTGERDMQDRGLEFRVTVRPLALF